MKSIIYPMFFVASVLSAQTYTGDIYWRQTGNANVITDGTMYSIKDGSSYTNITDASNIDWEQCNLIFDGSLNGGNNAVNWVASGTLKVSNMTVENYSPTSGVDVFFPLGNGTGTLWVENTLSIKSAWRGNGVSNNSLRAGSLNIENSEYGSSFKVRFGCADIDAGGQYDGFNKVTVDNGMTIKGNVIFQTSNLQTVDGSAASLSNPNISIGGVLNMVATSEGAGAGTPEWGAFFFSGDTRHTYVNLGGLSGAGSIYTMTYYTGNINDPRLYLGFTNTGTSEFAGAITSENHSKIDITMNGGAGGVQILRVSDYDNRGLNGNITVNSGTLKMYATLGMKTIGSSGDSYYQNGRTLTLNGGYFGAVAASSPSAGEADVGRVNVSDFTWGDGSLLVNYDASTGTASELNFSGNITLSSSDDTYGIYVYGDNLDSGSAINDFLTWDSANSDATTSMQSAIAAEAFKLYVNNVEWTATFSVADGKLSATLLQQIPEPAALAALMGCAALALAAWRRRK